MSAKVCFLRQADRAGRLASIRLVTERIGASSDESWTAPPNGSAGIPLENVEAGAQWLAERLAPSGRGELGLMCLDADGSLCSWISSPTADPEVVAALARQAGGGAHGAEEGHGPLNPVAAYAQNPLEASVQVIGAPKAEAPALLASLKKEKRGARPVSQRLAVLVASDTPARLVLDVLDSRGVEVRTVVSIWQLMAGAWDPGAERSGARSEAAAIENSVTTGVVLIDPAGRLLWAWSRAGELLAAGSMRLAAPRGQGRVEYGAEQVGRLATEWLSWSAQIGATPSRIVCIAPEEDAESPERARAFGSALAASWNGAPVDLVLDADPLLATLRRAARLVDDAAAGERAAPLPELAALARRPGRAHRGMYAWAALAVAFGAVALGALAVGMRGQAKRDDRARLAVKAQYEELIEKVYPAAIDNPEYRNWRDGQVRALEDEVSRRERELRPPDRAEAVMPVLQELETISLVVASSGVPMESLEVDSIRGVILRVTAPDLARVDDLLEALGRVSGSRVGSWERRVTPGGAPGRYPAVYTGTWSQEVRGRPEGGGA